MTMACFKPLRAFQSAPGMPVTFSMSKTTDKALDLACGQCIGCRLERSRQWATRCVHEASMWEDNCFITLTYDDENIPWDGSLNKTHFQKFMKRLRRKYEPKTIRYFHCGEYGEQLKRPHYHALLFNHDFDDKELWSQREGINTYRSSELEKLWPFGFSTVGQLTWETAAYCSRYVMKKMTGDNEHYFVQLTEEMEVELEPEYVTMSLKPAIGRTWYETYKRDCYPSDFITHRGKKFRVPKYYDKLYAEEEPEKWEAVRSLRERKAEKWTHENSAKRLAAREQCTFARMAHLSRPLEETFK